MPEGLSIIIVSYNTKDVLRSCLISVRAAMCVQDEVIVIDNASPDGSAEMVALEFPEFRLVASEENVGFSPANNIGMELATGVQVMLLNPDTIVPEGAFSLWRSEHVASGATLSGPTLVGVDGHVQMSSWRTPKVRDVVLELFFLHHVFGPARNMDAMGQQDHEAGFVSGAAMLFNRDLFERIGGLDPEMFWMEDADFCVRVKQVGGKVMFLHRPRIVHIGGESSKKNLARAISNQLVSRIKFMRKHRGMFAVSVVTISIYLHAVSRMVLFMVIALFRTEPRASAYRHAWVKLNRYLFTGDRSI